MEEESKEQTRALVLTSTTKTTVFILTDQGMYLNLRVVSYTSPNLKCYYSDSLFTKKPRLYTELQLDTTNRNFEESVPFDSLSGISDSNIEAIIKACMKDIYKINIDYNKIIFIKGVLPEEYSDVLSLFTRFMDKTGMFTKYGIS